MKAKLIWFILLLFAPLLLLAFLYWPTPKPISPLSQFTPNLTNKLQKKIAPPLVLDFSQSASISSLLIPHYLVFNLDSGKVYAAKAEAQSVSPASFTKLLTSQVALDLSQPDQLLTVTKSSADRVPTILGLRAGEQFKLSDLLRASIATSANDAATTIAESVATQNSLVLSDFINLMNSKAALLKMDNSHFANPDGLDDSTQKTTLLDLSKLVVNTISAYPEIMSAAASDRQDIETSNLHAFYYLSNWNGLLGVYPGVFGLKIAYTETAGYSTIVLSQRNNVRLGVIVSGANSLLARDQAAATLLDLGFKKENIPPASLSQSTLKRHYQVWDDLITKTRKALVSQKPL